MAKGLYINIFRTSRNGRIQDCTNGGVSSLYDTAIVIGPGIPELFDGEPHRLPVLRLENNRNTGTLRLVPVDLEGKWVMMGGNFGHTSDSRFAEACEAILGHRFYGAVAIHDRVEG